MMIYLYFIAAILATWRVAHLLSEEDGPFDIVFMLRKKAAAGFWGGLLSCFFCVSVWVSIPFGLWLGNTVIEKIVFWLAVSGGAGVLYKLTDHTKDENNTPHYEEDKE
jgi:hypothetical protein